MGSGKGGKVTVGYKYHLGMHASLCHGPIDKITRIRFDKRVAWEAGECEGFAGGSITVDAEELFGGDGREGGVSGVIDIEMGRPNQSQNDYLAQQLGSSVPAYRGIVGAVFRQFYFGNNPYLKPVDFRASRIHVRQDGESQWYDEKAAIQRLGGGQFNVSEASYVCIPVGDPDYLIDEAATVEAHGWDPDPYPPAYDDVGYFIKVDGVSPDDILVVSALPGGYGWSRWQAGNPDGGSTPWGYDFHVTDIDDNTTEFFVGDRYATQQEAKAASVSSSPVYISGSTNYKFWLRDAPVTDNRGDVRIQVHVLSNDIPKYCREIITPCCDDLNPAHIVRECLTDPDWGMGYPESDIDDDSFMYAADVFHGENMGMSLLWGKEIPIEDFVYEVQRHVDAVLYVDRRTGKFNLKPVRNDNALSDMIILDESSVIEVRDARIPAVDDLVSSVTVKFWDAVTGENGSVTEHNHALQQIQQGRGSSTTREYLGFATRALAAQVARRDLAALSTPLQSCTIICDRVPENLYPGFAFILNWPDLGINYLVMRVQEMSLGDGVDNAITIDAVEDVFDLPAFSTVNDSPQNGLWVDPALVAPQASSPRVVTEVPYYQLVMDYGELDINAILEDDSDAGFLLAAGGRPGTEINAQLHVDSGAGYENVAALDFSPYAYTVDDVDITDTVIYVVGGGDLDLIETGSIAQIESELVRIDAVSTDSNGQFIEVGRGVLDTVPAEHLLDSNGDGIAILVWGYSPASDAVQYVASDQVDVKMRTVLGASMLPLSDAPADSVIMASRAYRPYPPGDLRVDGISYPDPESSSAVYFDGVNLVSWKHRDRLQQTDGNLYDHTAGNIGPEVGTTYILQAEGFDASGASTGTFVDKNVGLVGSYVFGSDDSEPGAGTELVQLSVYSVRDGYQSWQPAQASLAYGGDSSAEEGGDPLWGYVWIYLDFEGQADGSTSIANLADQGGSTPTFSCTGAAQIDDDNGNAEYGDGAGEVFGGAGNSIRSTDAPALGTGDFCLDFSINIVAGASGSLNYLSYVDAADTGYANGFALYSSSGSPNTVRFYYNGADRITGTMTRTTGYHKGRLERKDGVTRLFVGGSKIGSDYPDTNNYTATSFALGSIFAGFAGAGAYFDNVRLTLNFRDGGNYTPATAPFPMA